MASRAKKPKQDRDLIKEIRDNYDWSVEYWGPIHKAGNEDVKFIAGDPWDPLDVQARNLAEQKRPHLVFDEGSQYINMFCGQVRQQKRAVKVDPVDERADSDTAKVMMGRIMHVEYVSRAQSHYIKALSDAATRGYGWVSIRKRYSTETGREQEPCVNPVSNPDSRLMDPNAKEPDGSDAEFCFVRDICKKSYVKKTWPWARDLGGKDVRTVTLTEYWRVIKQPVDCVYLIDDGSENGLEVKESQLEDMNVEFEVTDRTLTIEGKEYDILDEREICEKQITKYICQIVDPSLSGSAPDAAAEDSIEILEEEPWDGKYIPEIPCYGQEYYVNENGTVKKVYLSMLRRARDAMQLLNLTRTNQAELVAMTPKTRFLGYEGQFEGHEDEFANIGTSPIAYLQVRPIVDPTSNTVLQLPEPIRWEPPIQALELLAQACQNAVRSAIGQLASPELDKTKSGIALDKIREGGESAVYHIKDNYDRCLEQVGRVMGDLMERTHDTKRQVAIRNASEEQELVQINEPYDDKKTGKRRFYPIEEGAFSYTISIGPSYQSQYQQTSDFVDMLVSKVPQLLVDGRGQTTLGDLVVKLKNMGPLGDEIVDRFKKLLRPELQDETKDIPPAILAELQKGQQAIDLLAHKLQAAQDLIENKTLELQSEERRAEQDNKTKIAIAEINAQVKENIVELQASMDQIALQMNQQWEAMQGSIQHQQNLEVAAQQHQQTLEQQQNQAKLAPEPEQAAEAQ